MNALQYFGGTLGIEFDEYITEPYKEFLAGKKTLVTTAKPRRPLALSRIGRYAAADVPALLRLESRAQ